MSSLPEAGAPKPKWWAVAWRWCLGKRRQMLGLLLLLLAIGATGLIATVDITKDGGSTVALLLVVIAALLQGASAFTFSGVGKADPTLARSTVRRLFQLTQRAAAARGVAVQAFDEKMGDDERRQLVVVPRDVV
ncbi:hypothetical protein [Microbacterium sp. PMB16]|uniref:hypothetical protein n=1 Tax=Microbacterium sp. PMB16 TaxID=3120157 RepID=UPI003F4B0DB7